MLTQFMFVSLSSLNLWNLFQKILICMDTKKKKTTQERFKFNNPVDICLKS